MLHDESFNRTRPDSCVFFFSNPFYSTPRKKACNEVDDWRGIYVLPVGSEREKNHYDAVPASSHSPSSLAMVPLLPLIAPGDFSVSQHGLLIVNA